MRKLAFITLLSLLIQPLASQDFIFSQYFASQPYLNPAMTGFFDGSYRVNAQYRTQWSNIGSGGISTYGVNGEMKLGDHEGEKDYVGLGVGIYRDDLYGMLTNNTGRINVSYNKRLGYGETKHFLSLGANFGMDYSQLKNNILFPDGTSNWGSESPAYYNLYIPNAGLGLNYQIVFPSFANIFFGGSVDHLVSDKNSFTLQSNDKVPKRFTIYTSARLKVTDAVYLLPTILTVNQGNHRQINYGVSTQLLMREYYNYKTNLQLGVSARMGNEGFDAMIVSTRYENRGMQVGLSYDHNLNELNSATGGFGALELSLGYVGFIERILKSRSNCPNIKNF